MAKLKSELKEALAQPLVARGVSMRYITSGTRSRGVVDEIIEGQSELYCKRINTLYLRVVGHELLLGLSKVKAGSETVRKQKKKKSGLVKK